MIDKEDLPQEELEQIVTGPDFPTGGFICGREGIRDAYRTGRGRVVMRARAEIEPVDANSDRIVITATCETSRIATACGSSSN